jgi:hypothetical protein
MRPSSPPRIQRFLQRFVLLALVTSAGRAAGAQEADSTLARVQRLVNAGNRTAARAVADSIVGISVPGTNAHAEALFARAFASSSAADAERDYLRVTIEYPLSPRAEDALMMVAQLRLARGDRNGARRQFERMVREHPTGTQVAKASFWAGRLALEAGDAVRGCPSLAIAKEHLGAGDVELGNQIDYYRARCAGVPSVASAADTPSGVEGTPPPVTPPVTPPVRPARTPPIPPPTSDSAIPPADAPVRAANAKQFSVQVAAFPKKRDADALGEVLQQRGFEVRVFGTAPPFRVRVGRYDSREEAAAALGRMKASRVNGIVVEAEPR